MWRIFLCVDLSLEAFLLIAIFSDYFLLKASSQFVVVFIYFFNCRLLCTPRYDSAVIVRGVLGGPTIDSLMTPRDASLVQLYFFSGVFFYVSRTECLKLYTEKTRFAFPFKLNGIWSWGQFSFRFWTKWISIWFRKSKGKLSPRWYPIQFERKCKSSFLSEVCSWVNNQNGGKLPRNFWENIYLTDTVLNMEYNCI